MEGSALLSHKGCTINKTNFDIKPAEETPWEEAAASYHSAAESAERARRWWHSEPAHTRDIPKTVDWSVAGFAAGIGLYFGLSFEPDLGVAIGMVAAAIFLWILAEKHEVKWRAIPILVFMVLGFGRAVWHSHEAQTPFLDEGFYSVTGWIEAIEKSGSGVRWRLRVHNIEGRNLPEGNIRKIRVKINAGKDQIGPNFKGGDGVTLSAILSAPPPPVVPNGYDPARRAYFQGLSAYGFSTSIPAPVSLTSRNISETFSRRLTRYRYSLAQRVRAQAPLETAGLQVALLTGIRSYIPDSQVDSLRAAGLAHVLAISGLHMGLLAGGAYWLASLGLACITPLSRRYDMRKIAAIIGALAATAYLLLSGASVATQRAYVMSLIVFLAVILDRRAFSIRSVSIAALLTLALHPEALMSAGFQMSFAAVTALVVVYRHWQGPVGTYGPLRQTWGARFISGLSTLSITSFVAGSATSVYALMHFNRMAKWGFAGNLLAMPIFTFLVMPAALLSLIAMPLGLEAAPLRFMGYSLMALLRVSDNVAGWPGALTYIKSPHEAVLALYSLGFLWLCLGGKRLRLISLAIFAICAGLWAFSPTPDLRVSDDGRIALLQKGRGQISSLYVSSKRADKYGREQFTQRAGIAKASTQSYKDTLALCDALACRLTFAGRTVSIINHPSEVIEECEASDLVIIVNRRSGPVARRNCAAALIDERDFKANGAYDVFLSSKELWLKPANPKARRARPWGISTYRKS